MRRMCCFILCQNLDIKNKVILKSFFQCIPIAFYVSGLYKNATKLLLSTSFIALKKASVLRSLLLFSAVSNLNPLYLYQMRNKSEGSYNALFDDQLICDLISTC